MRPGLLIQAGAEAARRLREEGWHPDLFSLLVGASGGPKWFILSHLDRLLFGDFLRGRSQPLDVIGSSIGSWRHACLALADPAAAVERFEQSYLHHRYSPKPDAAEISDVSLRLLRVVLGASGARELLGNGRIRTHIVTARGRGPAASTASVPLATGLAAAALANSIGRQRLSYLFQRVVFYSGPSPQAQLPLDDFGTRYVPLTQQNLLPALHAGASIPFALTGERNIPGAPPGQYWDGGILDYHFDLAHFRGDGLVLYPHFRADLTPGWFDKFLRRRRVAASALDHLVLVSPHPELIASLPHGKIPDRNDFYRMSHDERVRYWTRCVEMGRALAEAFHEIWHGPDPMAGVVVPEGWGA